MTPTTQNGNVTKTVTRTVFDLATFDDVKLAKQVNMPAKPTSIEEALAAVGNDQSKLLNVLYEGLVKQAQDAAYEEIQGFKVLSDESKVTDPETWGETYSGKFADDTKSALINGAVLGLAKMWGYDKGLPKDRKRELKDKAIEFLRSNPAMLASIQG